MAEEAFEPVGMMGTLRDISDIKQFEEALQKSHKKLEDKVKKRTKKLAFRNRQLEKLTATLKDVLTKKEELNTALGVMLTKKEEEKTNLEKNILSYVNKLVLPYLDKLIKRLETEMNEAARDLEFERAAELRDRIKALKEKYVFEF